MQAKSCMKAFLVCLTAFIWAVPLPAKQITLNELADVCEQMESAIEDISISYQWRVRPPYSAEETEDWPAATAIYKDGVIHSMLLAAGPVSYSAETTEQPAFKMLLMQEQGILENPSGQSWAFKNISAYDGKQGQTLSIDSAGDRVRGSIFERKPQFRQLNLTPLGFSVLRLRNSILTDYRPLSMVMRDLGKIDNTVEKIGRFSTIRVDLLQKQTQNVLTRVYFSVDHCYTPVRYEYMRSGKDHMTIEVGSLEQVADNLWFPSSGIIRQADSERVNLFTASEILVNQGLGKEDFDIEFPAGTEVTNEITGRTYTVDQD